MTLAIVKVLPRAGDAEQRLLREPVADAVDQLPRWPAADRRPARSCRPARRRLSVIVLGSRFALASVRTSVTISDPSARSRARGRPVTSASRKVSAFAPRPPWASPRSRGRLRAAGHDVIVLWRRRARFCHPQAHQGGCARRARAKRHEVHRGRRCAELKDAIIAKLKRENGLEYTPQQVLVANGAKHVLFNVCQALLEPGDEVIVPAPYWVSYPDIVLMAGGVPVTCRAGEQGFKITAEQLESAITPKTRLLILNSPCNPTRRGVLARGLDGVGEVLRALPRVSS